VAIVVEGLSKAYGSKKVVDDLSFEVVPGQITGFLGPNGAGKSTTMRCMVSLDRSDSGQVSVDGSRYADLQYPARVVGTLLEANAVNPSRSARGHLRMLAACSRVPDSRVDEVLEVTGITSVAGQKVGGFSLGMHQRLGLAAAILADPTYLMLDEPTNGLDPEGIRWVRDFLRALAAEGRAVFVSSHLLAELALFVDHLVVIGRGRLITTGAIDEITQMGATEVVVRTPDAERLTAELVRRGATVTPDGADLRVTGAAVEAVGDLAALLGIPLHGLRTEGGSLEDVFLELTASSQEYRSTARPGGTGTGTEPGTEEKS
jgi:ABC-2 type transport system ATP-binding protein